MVYDDKTLKKYLVESLENDFAKFYIFSGLSLITFVAALIVYFIEGVPLILPISIGIVGLTLLILALPNYKHYAKFKYLSNPDNLFLLNTIILDGEEDTKNGKTQYFLIFKTNDGTDKKEVSLKEYEDFEENEKIIVIYNKDNKVEYIIKGSFLGTSFKWNNVK